MQGLIFLQIIGEIDPIYIQEAQEQKDKSKIVLWSSLYKAGAAMLCMGVAFAFFLGILPHFLRHNIEQNKGQKEVGTLIGADEIYPTVMVNGKCYEWRRGRAIVEELPKDSVYYGKVKHKEDAEPSSDCEFVSKFKARGKIYLSLDEDSCVYILMTTEWFEDKIVIFDEVEK